MDCNSMQKDCNYRIRGYFLGLPIFAVFRGQYESAKIEVAKYFTISPQLD